MCPNVNANAANGSLRSPIEANENVNVIELTMNFYVPSQIWSKNDIPHSHVAYRVFGILALPSNTF